MEKSESQQADFLVLLSKRASNAFHGFEEVKETLLRVSELLVMLQKGDKSVRDELLRFIEDPDMSSDFAHLYEIVKADDRASAALHIVSYSCAFNLRVSAKVDAFGPLPDPIVEATPDVYQFYMDQAKELGIT